MGTMEVTRRSIWRMKKFKVILLCATDDPDCSSDYYGVEILQDGKIIQEYGDAYHDSGYEKMEGFFDALSWIHGKKIVPKIVKESCFDLDSCCRVER